MKTLGNLLKYGAARFEKANLYFGHGTDNAWDEAVWIALHVLQLPLDVDSKVSKRILTNDEITKIKTLYKQRIKERKPTAYLLNEAWFAGLPFYVDERVIVPRSPMAELIAKKFKAWHKENVLDLCTGSACIAIAIAKAFPESHVDAVDISKDALAVAKINVKKHGVSKHVTLIKSNLFAALEGKKYDIIISNPPYVDAHDMETLPAEYTQEPELALAAGDDGLDLVDHILREAKNYLTPTGLLIVEVGNSHVALKKKYPKLPFQWMKFTKGEGDVFLLREQDLREGVN